MLYSKFYAWSLYPCYYFSFPMTRGGEPLIPSRATYSVDYRWRATGNNWFYPKILPLSYYKG